MNLSAVNLLKNSCQTKYQSGFRYSNLKPLACDTVSFGAMKKNGFEGIDLLVVNKFKAPIEKFNSNGDFQKWCKDKIEELKERDLEGRSEEITIQRRATFQEWCSYVENENDAYTDSIALLILDGILKDIDKNNDMEIPSLNKRALADTVDKISRLNGDVNFKKEYMLSVQNIALDNLETHIDSDKTGWVVIPSKKHDKKHFEENVDKLKSLSYKTWCTASFNAEPYLKEGDFHVYLEKGRPKLGVRFIKNKIKEVQGEKNNSIIPAKYLDTAREHLSKYKLLDDAKAELEASEIKKQKLYEMQNKMEEKGINLKTCTPEQLYDVLGIGYEVDDNGYLIIDEYRQPCENFITFEDLGINEDKLFERVKAIKGNADFRESKLTELYNLKSIGGDANFKDSQVEFIDNLESIGGNANFYRSKITEFKNLKNIGGDAKFNFCKVPSLGELEYIGGNADFTCSHIVSLGKLKKIGGNADFTYSKKDIDFENLKSIGGEANFYMSKIKSLQNIESIGGFAKFNDSEIVDFGKLRYIGGNANFCNTHMKSLQNIERIGGNAYFGNSNITDLGNLEYVGGDICLTLSRLNSGDFMNIVRKGKIHNF